MKHAALYARVSTADQTPENQLIELRKLAEQRGFEAVKEYIDHGISGTRARRPGLDAMLADARLGRFQVLMTWACDRVARSTRHFLDTLDELNRLGVQFISLRENIDTDGPLGRAIVTIIAAIAELERSLIVERVKAGMRRARMEGRHIGRYPTAVDREAVLRERKQGHSLTQIAKTHGVSRAMVCRIVKQEKLAGHEG